MGEKREGYEVQVMENLHDLTKSLWISRIPASLKDGEQALLVVGIRKGVSVGPYAYDVNTAAALLDRLGTLDEGEYKGEPVAATRPKDVSEFIVGALRGAEQEGERGIENTATFWLTKLSASGKPDTSSVRRWTYRSIGTPQARITYDAHDVPTRSLREAIKEHAKRLQQLAG